MYRTRVRLANGASWNTLRTTRLDRCDLEGEHKHNRKSISHAATLHGQDRTSTPPTYKDTHTHERYTRNHVFMYHDRNRCHVPDVVVDRVVNPESCIHHVFGPQDPSRRRMTILFVGWTVLFFKRGTRHAMTHDHDGMSPNRFGASRSTALLVTRLHRGGAEGASFACRSGNTIHSFIRRVSRHDADTKPYHTSRHASIEGPCGGEPSHEAPNGPERGRCGGAWPTLGPVSSSPRAARIGEGRRSRLSAASRRIRSVSRAWSIPHGPHGHDARKKRQGSSRLDETEMAWPEGSQEVGWGHTALLVSRGVATGLSGVRR